MFWAGTGRFLDGNDNAAGIQYLIYRSCTRGRCTGVSHWVTALAPALRDMPPAGLRSARYHTDGLGPKATRDFALRRGTSILRRTTLWNGIAVFQCGVRHCAHFSFKHPS